MSLRRALVLVVLLVLAALLWTLIKTQEERNGQQQIPLTQHVFVADTYGFRISYPAAWDPVLTDTGTTACPEEDTYRTQDTLSRYDRAYTFPVVTLPGSTSTIQSGIRVYTITDDQEVCQDQLVRGLANGTVDPLRISSVRLEWVGDAIHNENASRLDTEYQEQYTYIHHRDDGTILIVQPYLRFTPHADTLEWQEIQLSYQNDMTGYINNGTTAAPVRAYRDDFRSMATSVTFSTGK